MAIERPPLVDPAAPRDGTEHHGEESEKTVARTLARIGRARWNKTFIVFGRRDKYCTAHSNPIIFDGEHPSSAAVANEPHTVGTCCDVNANTNIRPRPSPRLSG